MSALSVCRFDRLGAEDRRERVARVVARDRIGMRELARDERRRVACLRLAERVDRHCLLVRLAERQARAHDVRAGLAVERPQRRAIVGLAPPALHRLHQLADALVGVTERALERTIVLDARPVRRRSDAVVAAELHVERHVLPRHVARDARSAGAVRRVVAVRALGQGGLELLVAAEADLVAGRTLERGPRLLAVMRVGVVAARAAHPARAGAEQEVARLPGADVAAARDGVGAPAALPGVRIGGEQHLMTASAGAVDRLRARRGGIVGHGLHVEGRAVRHEARLHARMRHVLLAAAVTGLAADPDLEQVARVEAAPHGADEKLGPARRRAVGDGRGAERAQLRVDRGTKRRRIGDRNAPAPIRREEGVHHLALIRLAGARDRAERRREEGLGVVTEDAGAGPGRARSQAGSLGRHHRVALVPIRALADDVGDRKHAFLGARRADLDPCEVLAHASADDPRDPKDAAPLLLGVDGDESLPVALLEDRAILLEAEHLASERCVHLGPRDEAGHAVHGRARPGLVFARVTRLAALRAGVVGACDIAADAVGAGPGVRGHVRGHVRGRCGARTRRGEEETPADRRAARHPARRITGRKP